jgi:hypothetical protein
MRCARPLHLTFLVLLWLVLPVAAQAPTDNVLTNADIVKMVKAGLPENIIVREIQMSRTDFGTSPSALIELKKQGASEGVLGAVLDSRMGASQPRSEPPPESHLVAQSAAPGSHHLSSFQADVRINPKVNGKVSMGHNQIKVERSGVPVFSLKWKETKSPSK